MSKNAKYGSKLPPPYDAVIVGAGAAGLYAADRLNRAGMSFVIVEANTRSGGRIQSRPERGSELGLMIDEGANLINSTDTLAIGLLNRFDIPYVKRLLQGVEHMNYVFKGKVYDQAAMQQLLFAENAGSMTRLSDDQDFWNSAVKRDIDPRFINESIAEYLQRIEAGPSLVTMLHSFFWSEYGRKLDELNLHVLFDYLALDNAHRAFTLIPNADEAYTVPGGTGQIIAALQGSLEDHIKFARRAFRITDRQGDRVTVECHNAQGQIENYEGDAVIFAAPLHSLAQIAVSVSGLKPEALARARTATYALGTKLHLKFSKGFQQLYKFRGIVLTDGGEQIWSSATGQGEAGLLTVLTGPMSSSPEATLQRAKDVLATLEVMAPGCSSYFAGVERSDAPLSYSGSLRPGEQAHLSIHDGSDRWFTVGEASGGDLQGYLEGAFRSAERETLRLMVRTKRQTRHTAGIDFRR